MDSLNTIQIIHAADADQHLGHLKKILDALKSENRIKDFSTLESEAVNENSLASLSDGDMVITLLTNGIVPVKTLIEETMIKAKTRLPEAKMAEIIIDHVPYENQFIAFPSDLQPIRSREDMDGVWSNIGQTLREIFPPQEEPEDPVAPVPWKKYLPYVLGALALILLFYLIPAPDDDEMKVVTIETSVISLETDTNDCPKQFDFQGNIKVNAPGKVVYTWVRSDGQQGAVDTLKFEEAGEKQVTSSWVLGSEGKKYKEWQQLKIISPNNMVSDQEAIAFECKGEDSGPTGTGDSIIPTLSEVTATVRVSGDAKIEIDCGKRHRFSFSGIIKANGQGRVNYVWVGNDGKTSPTQTLDFQNAGSQRVSTTKTLVASSENGYEGWQQLKVVSPKNVASNVANFFLGCRATASAGAAVLRHVSDASNTKGHITTINNAATNGKSTAILMVTQKYGYKFGTYNVNEIGVWYSNGKWTIFNQNRKPIPKGVIFNILVIPPNSGKSFVHTTRSNNVTGHITTLNSALTNAKPNALVYVTQNYGKYNTVPVGVWYSQGKWKIYNEKTTQRMPIGTKFNIVVLNPGESRIGNLKVYGFKYNNNSTGHISTMGVPRSFGTQASLLITQNFNGVYNPNVTGVWLNGSKKWTAFNQNRKTLAKNVRFNVLVTKY